MVIKGAKTIKEYKEIQKEHIQKWVDERFISGSVTWEMDGVHIAKLNGRVCGAKRPHSVFEQSICYLPV